MEELELMRKQNNMSDKTLLIDSQMEIEHEITVLTMVEKYDVWSKINLCCKK